MRFRQGTYYFSGMITDSITRRELLCSLCASAGISALPVSGFCAEPPLHKAMFEIAREGNTVQCGLCPHGCILAPGQISTCRVRTNKDGVLSTYGYANPCAIHVDPVEKKPLYHVLPGSRVYSLAIAGCNFRCKNCQNWSISQKSPRQTRNTNLSPQQAVEHALRQRCDAIAYTYSEPTVWYEYMYDTARLAHQKGLRNILVTCGFINRKPLEQLSPFIDAANIDLKSFDPAVYQKLNAGKRDPILETIAHAAEMGIWVEITNLVIPGWTDDLSTISRMCEWLHTSIGAHTPLHFSRFYPSYKLRNLAPTPADVLHKARQQAQQKGLHYVYLGNVPGADSNTRCPGCGRIVIARRGYRIEHTKIKDGRCSFCGHTIEGLWESKG